jgi:hypothetical protein
MELGADRTDDSGAFAIGGAQGDTPYELQVKRFGYDFSGAPPEAEGGDELVIVGARRDLNPSMCRASDVSLALEEAAGFAREVWQQGALDNNVLSDPSAEAIERLNLAYRVYLERSSEFPDVLLMCAKARSAGYSRVSVAREKRLLKRGVTVLLREAFFANRRLREEGQRTLRETKQIKKTLDRAAARASRHINRFPRYTFRVQ